MRLSVPEMLLDIAREDLALFSETVEAVKMHGTNFGSMLLELGYASEYWIGSGGAYWVEMPDDTDVMEAARTVTAWARLERAL